MSKSKYFSGQPIFSQLLSFLPRTTINKIASEHKSDHYYKNFKTHDHLIALLFGVFNKCNSLREITTGLMGWGDRINHLAINYYPRRSTFADANTNRNADVFESIYQHLYFAHRHLLPDSRTGKKNKNLFIADSTTITLFQEILKGVGVSPINGKRKGGIKVHTLEKYDEDVPCLIRYSAAAACDSPFMKHINLAKGSVLVVDKGYNSYADWNRLNEQGITWVTRFRERTVFTVLKNRSVTGFHRFGGIISDTQVKLGNKTNKKGIKVICRMIEYQDPESGKKLTFITNNLKYSPLTIAGYYRKRWRIEMLFKRIKQNFPLSNFIGQSENAVKIQIWAVLIADLLTKIINSKIKKRWAFSNLIGMIRIHLGSYINLRLFLENPEKTLEKVILERTQLSLFSP